MNTTTANGETCDTCYGEGAIPSEHGPLECSDCAGQGVLPSGLVRTEWRLRQLEKAYATVNDQHAQDIRFLIDAVRRSHHALLQILAIGQEQDADDTSLLRIRFLANEAIGLYPVTSRKD